MPTFLKLKEWERTYSTMFDLLGQVKKDAPVLTILWLELSHTATITTRKLLEIQPLCAQKEDGGWLLVHSTMGKVGNKGREVG